MKESITVHVGNLDTGNYDIAHDNREHDKHQNKDINVNQSAQNIVQQNYENEKSAYDDIFGNEVAEYNSKQKNKSRVIKNYYEKVKSSSVGFGKHKHIQEPAKQIMLAVGKAPDNPDDPDGKEPPLHLLDTDPKEAEFRKQVLLKYTNEFQQRNPNMVIVNNAIHMDEPNVHAHLTFVPYFHSSRGLSKKYGLNSSIKETIARNRGVATKDVKDSSRKLFNEWIEGERTEIAKIAKDMNPNFELVRVGSHGYMKPKDFKKFKKRELELKKSQVAQIKSLDPTATIQSDYETGKMLSIQDKDGYAAFLAKDTKQLADEIKHAEKVHKEKLKHKEQEIKHDMSENYYTQQALERERNDLNTDKSVLASDQFKLDQDDYVLKHDLKKEKCEMIKSLEPRLKLEYQNNERVGYGVYSENDKIYSDENKKKGKTTSDEIQTTSGFNAFMKQPLNCLNRVLKWVKERYERLLKEQETKIKELIEKAEKINNKKELETSKQQTGDFKKNIHLRKIDPVKAAKEIAKNNGYNINNKPKGHERER